MKYEAIIFDLDGTAMPSAPDALPSKAVIDTVKKYKEKIHLCAATGRSWPRAKNIITALGLTDPCITSGGALIIDPAKKDVLWEERISLDDVTEIKQAVGDYPYKIAFTQGLETRYASNIKRATLDYPLTTLYILDVPAKPAEEIIGKLSHINGVTVTKAYSWVLPNGIDLHITNRRATKEHGVIELCNLLKVNRSNVAGVGDSYNDIHLFNAVGHKIAMGNAVPDLKEVADIVIDTLEEEGLASFIESSVQEKK